MEENVWKNVRTDSRAPNFVEIKLSLNRLCDGWEGGKCGENVRNGMILCHKLTLNGHTSGKFHNSHTGCGTLTLPNKEF